MKRLPVTSLVLATLASGMASTVVAQVLANPSSSSAERTTGGMRMVRDAMVTDGDAEITVSRIAGMPAVLSVETGAGKFVLAGDSAVLARWADSADASPTPTEATKKRRPVWRS